MGGRGSGGRNRKPLARKMIEGSRIRDGKHTLDPSESVAWPGEPPIPSCRIESGRKVWPEVVKILEENGVLFRTDGIAIAALCSSFVLFRKAEAAIEKYGAILTTADGESGVTTMKKNPAIGMRSDALKHLRASWQCFGLDPVSRSGLGLDVARKPSSQGKSALDSIWHPDLDEIIY